jgi:hypothetical protein
MPAPKKTPKPSVLLPVEETRLKQRVMSEVAKNLGVPRRFAGC